MSTDNLSTKQITGNPLTKHDLWYATLNIYGEDKKRVRKWIPTGLPERGNKRNAESINNLLKSIIKRDGTLIAKYAGLSDPIEVIAQDFNLPETTLLSLREIYGVNKIDINLQLQNAISRANAVPTIDQESDEYIRKMFFCDYMGVSKD